ncbi:xanthine dehydrogenase family protein molybdopterin-binding subunit [Paraferrimonas sedimenticola]|uniref:Xanthine dehydrogenase n=1 Tax=Paraferrimonas sedimenticola TaxID=375674 RepID=A0AA37RVV1_9GAMM|nr:molybdopterin cofactor-binding domain-containing protein [Paraferrimonas sedimenticola]GLP96695.1 xanthine dehydrogenase [Paraferrimonas sedimenticola]
MSLYPNTATKVASVIAQVSRRSFLKGMGLGGSALVLGGYLPGFASLSANAKDNALRQLNVFVSIAPSGQTQIVCHRAEMGQGIHTSVPQIIADELEADWSQVVMLQGKADKSYGSQGTTGSSSIRRHFEELRRLGAAAKHMLMQAASERLGVPMIELRANNHKVIAKDGRELGYGELAVAASELEAPKAETLTLKAQKDFSLIGKEVKLFDLDDIVAGSAVYAQDIMLDNMLVASIVRPPVVGGKPKSVDDSEAMKVAGVKAVVTLKSRGYPVSTRPLGGVAVLATNTWAALKGRQALKVEWDDGDNAVHNTQSYMDELKSKVNQKGIEIRAKGDVYQHSYDKARTVEATYSVPYLNHTPMETPAATAWVQGEGADKRVQVWAGTQNPQWAQSQVMAELGIDKESPERAEINLTLMGGAFGRKSKADFILEAVELSDKVKQPVKVVWSREDDIQHGFYHSISANYLKAELTEKGTADHWIQRVAYPPIGWIFDTKRDMPNHGDLSVGFGDTPFALNNLSFETQKVSSHMRTGWVRSVACINNGFALGSFVDEMAVKAGISTRQMWLNLLGPDRLVDPRPEGFEYSNYGMSWETNPIDIKRMKDLINWIADLAKIEEELPDNQGWGLSFLRSFGSYVAAATKVEVIDNKVKVLEMHTAVDIGVAVTPDRVKSQMEGAMVFGLSIALMGEISVVGGKVEQSNFHDAPVTRMDQVPPMYVHIMESNEAPGGVGEPGVPPIIPSITNAIYHASGVRVRDLPVNKVMKV